MNDNPATRKLELAEKTRRLEQLLSGRGLAGVALFKFSNYAWYSCGGSNRVVTGSERGCSVLVYLEGRRYVLAPVNEIERLCQEELAGLDFTPLTYPWYENPLPVLEKLAAGRPLAADVPLPGLTDLGSELDRLRFVLTASELTRARELAAICARETAALCAALRPGMSEWQISAELSRALLNQGVRPAVLLVGVDERVTACRHPVPGNRELERYALISLVGEKWGLHVTLTRCAYLGSLPAGLRERHRRVCEVDADLMAASRPGLESGEIFSLVRQAYARVGYPQEWQCHHQGGAIGYAPREYRLGEREEVLLAGQMFGYNPTISGTKSEDTILLTENGLPQVLTPVPAWWPQERCEVAGGVLLRPAILEL
ncbi:MAG: M24 family metallopeptidase [Desulfurispora sp.]|uniref:M24 family metallopeptidase n=1 Tax=Desulfurispora sp. TaxID=3014275 RepID=UPI00404A98F0